MVDSKRILVQPRPVIERRLVLLLLPPQALPMLPSFLSHRLGLQLRGEALGLGVVLAILLHRRPLQPTRHLLRLRVVLMRRDGGRQTADRSDAGSPDRRRTLRDCETGGASANHRGGTHRERSDERLHRGAQVRDAPSEWAALTRVFQRGRRSGCARVSLSAEEGAR